MNYIATSINQSPVITGKANAAITDVRGKAVKFSSGKIVLCSSAGEAAIGVGLMTCGDEGAVAAGADVDIQVKDICIVLTSASVAAGAELAVDANAKFKTATAGQYVCAIALEAASAAGYIKARLVNYQKNA